MSTDSFHRAGSAVSPESPTACVEEVRRPQRRSRPSKGAGDAEGEGEEGGKETQTIPCVIFTGVFFVEKEQAIGGKLLKATTGSMSIRPIAEVGATFSYIGYTSIIVD